jgi:pyruvate-ferredoxin/flavodoxin oxidoreductase
MMDGNEAAAHVAYRTNEAIAIYPITPSSPMGELADQWSVSGISNMWGTTPRVLEMQSEGGAAGAVHGSLQTGCLTTTFTASQGLLLMIPNMYKIAGELTSTVFHIAARSVATHALSIFGDHSDVMAARATGWAMLFANSVQEVMDFSLVAQASTLEGRVPFLHVFDGFRTSHEVQKIDVLTDDDIRALVDDELVRAHRARALTPDRPVVRGTAQNPDVFFQAREAVNPYYLALPAIVQSVMDRLGKRTGRRYQLFEYVGAKDADRVIVLMGSGCDTAEETVDHLVSAGEKVGVVKVRLFRPFSVEHFLAALPKTVKAVAVLDRTKEPGSAGEPLYQDVVTAISEGMTAGTAPFEKHPRVVGGRYGLASKEFTPSMIKGIFDELAGDAPKNHFTVGIVDDVTHTSINYDPEFNIEPSDTFRAMFWGLGSDGTVGANRNSIRIIGGATKNYVQGYFVYDSRKAGARTISHLRYGRRPIRSAYLIERANFVAVHQFGFLDKYDTLAKAEEGATFLLNSTYGPYEVWEHLPARVQRQIIEKRLNFHVIDAYAIARELRMGVRINTVMQTAFFVLSGVLPRDEAVETIKAAIRQTYGKRGQVVVRTNSAAVETALSHIHQVKVPEKVTADDSHTPLVADGAPEFIRGVTAEVMADQGDLLPVSALPPDGTFPSGTTRWEKRNIAQEVPVWEPDLCIQCGKCVMVCPHSVIRGKVIEEKSLAGAPAGFKSSNARWKELKDKKYTLQVAVEDCTGCRLCVEVCPAKDKSQVGRRAINMSEQAPLQEEGRLNWDFFLQLPDMTRAGHGDGNGLRFTKVKDVQLLEPLFEFSSACAGCGETPYLRLLSQLFGDRMLVANATGCSSIYGGNLPTTPWSKNKSGRGPAWSNSLFEDNAEFGLGMRLAIDKQQEYARELVIKLRDHIGAELARDLLKADQTTESLVEVQRQRVETLKSKLADTDDPLARDLMSVADALVKKSVWIVGGDGWGYDIGYGGVDHVLASGRNVNLLVLDTEVYSNTGGQASKATPLGAVAKFAAGGKATPKKDLGLIAMSYGHVYVAQVAMGADENQTIKAFEEAEAYDGPSLIVAYSQCIAHGIDMARGMTQQSLATASGYWPLYRYNPDLGGDGQSPLQIDSKPPKIPLQEYIYNENRYAMLLRARPDAAAELLQKAQQAVNERWSALQKMAKHEES